jgi:hypothetical protein
MNFTKYSKILILGLVTALISILFWFSFYLDLPQKLGYPKVTLETIFANYDGPNYMVVAKCGYVKSCIAAHFSLPMPLEYYPAHLPGFPLLIRYFSLYTTTPKAMLLAAFFGSIFLTLVTYFFFQLFVSPKMSFYLSLLSIFFPARMLVLRLVGAPETWFIGFILLSIILFYKNKYFWSALAAALSQIFKSPGILLFVAYGVLFLWEIFKDKNYLRSILKYLPYLLIPVSALAIFYVYYLQTGDFWAYFHSGDNFHLGLIPYAVFITNHTWVNSIWLEDILYIFFIAYLGMSRLLKKYHFSLVTVYPLIFTGVSILIVHRDISRYIAPVYPFLFLAFSKFLVKKNVRIILLLLIPAVILYTINFLIGNTAPIADWTPYL